MVYHESFSLDSSLLSRQENVALKGNATQSSTWGTGGYGASLAIDGGSVALDQTAEAKRSSMSLTESKAANSGLDVWWNLELDQDYIISQVIIFNRSDDSTSARIKGFVLTVLDKDGNDVFTHTDPGTYANADTPLSFVIDVNPNTVGKQVRIELPTGEYLQLQEVMVFGVVPPAVVPGDKVGQVCGGTYAIKKKKLLYCNIAETKTNSKLHLQQQTPLPFISQHRLCHIVKVRASSSLLDMVTSLLNVRKKGLNVIFQFAEEIPWTSSHPASRTCGDLALQDTLAH